MNSEGKAAAARAGGECLLLLGEVGDSEQLVVRYRRPPARADQLGVTLPARCRHGLPAVTLRAKSVVCQQCANVVLVTGRFHFLILNLLIYSLTGADESYSRGALKQSSGRRGNAHLRPADFFDSPCVSCLQMT